MEEVEHLVTLLQTNVALTVLWSKQCLSKVVLRSFLRGDRPRVFHEACPHQEDVTNLNVAARNLTPQIESLQLADLYKDVKRDLVVVVHRWSDVVSLRPTSEVE